MVIGQLKGCPFWVQSVMDANGGGEDISNLELLRQGLPAELP